MIPSFRRLQATPAYTQILQTLKADLKKAMIAKNNVEKNTIKSILATIKNKEIDGAKQTETSLAKMFKKMTKQRTDSAAMYKQQSRADLAEVEEQELGVIKKYVEALEQAKE